MCEGKIRALRTAANGVDCALANAAFAETVRGVVRREGTLLAVRGSLDNRHGFHVIGSGSTMTERLELNVGQQGERVSDTGSPALCREPRLQNSVTR